MMIHMYFLYSKAYGIAHCSEQFENGRGRKLSRRTAIFVSRYPGMLNNLKCNFGPLVYGKAPTTSENDLFFVFTISPLVSLLLSRFYRSKKYVRDIYQPDWKIQPSVGPADPPGRQSDRGTPCMFMRKSDRGTTWDPHPAPTRPNTMNMQGVPRSKLPALMGHPAPPMVVFSNLVDIYLQHAF